MKLSETQLWVINLMSNGYELGVSRAWSTSAWLQEGKIGCGGKCVKISMATFRSLRAKGMLKPVKTGFSTDSYVLLQDKK